MLKKILSSRKGICALLLVLLLIITGISLSIWHFHSYKNDTNPIDIETSVIDDSIEEKTTDTTEENDVVNDVSEEKTSEKETTKSTEKSSSNIKKENKSTETKGNSNNNQSSNSTTNQPTVEPKQEVQQQTTPVVETPKPTETVDLSKEVDTNSFFYSIHQGVTDTSTQSNCLSAGEEIAFLDTVDINYYRCYEVTSKANTIMGYYLNIFCESGNCNRYKAMIDMSKYK